MKDDKVYVLFFNGTGVIHLSTPPDENANAEIIAERYRFLKVIAGTLSRFDEDLKAAGQKLEAKQDK
jgi:hypothetical protein